MRILGISLQEISRNYYLRLDYKINMYYFTKKNYKNSWKIKDFLKIMKVKQLKPENFNEGYLIELEHIISGDAKLNEVQKVDRIGSDKVILSCANFAFCKLETGKGYFIAIPNDIPDYDSKSLIVGSTELVPCKVVINNKIAKYYLTHFKEIFDMFLSGKTHRRIHEIEFLNIELPRIKIDNALLEEIESKEQDISRLKTQIKETKLIVDVIFSKYFKLDIKQYSDLEKKHVFDKELCSLSKSVLLRSSLKFHHPKLGFILEKLKEFKILKLKQLLREPIFSGVKPEYDRQEGTIPVIKTVNIRDGYIDYNTNDYVNLDFISSIPPKYILSSGDIIITTHGEGRGKIGLLTLEDKDFDTVITDANCSVVRLKNGVNKEYIFYYLISEFGKTQLKILEAETKGVKYIPNEEIEKLIVIYPPPEIQNQIVNDIKTQLNNRKNIITQIEKLKQEIDDLIENSLIEKASIGEI